MDAPQGLNGQGTAASDSAIALGRHLIGRAVYDPDAAMAVYQRCGSAAASSSPLARAAVIGIWAGDAVSANAIAMEDAMLTDPGVAHVCGALAAAIAVGVAGGERSTMLLHLGALPDADRPHIAAMLLAVDHLSSGTGAESGVRDAVGRSEDAATITGALLGAVDGRVAFPPAWTMPVLTCRPQAGLGARNPRPPEYWTDDLVDLAEALLSARRDRGM